jgi:uncharacterized membrane protein YgcG
MSWFTDLITPVAGNLIKDVGDTVKQFVTTEGDKLLLGNKLTEIEAKFKTDMETLTIEIEKQRVQNASDINETMRLEAVAEHWATYSWRPFIGFVFGIMAFMMAGTVMASYIAVMLGYMKYDVLSYIPQMLASMAMVMGTIAPILGIASWYRGKMQADPSIPTDNRG